jgi:hypothetical protein
VDCAYSLLKVRAGDEILILNSASLAYMMGRAASEIKLMQEKLPPWVILIGIAGRDILPEEKVKVEEQDICEIAGRFALSPVSHLSLVNDKQVLETILQSSAEPYWRLNYKGGSQSIFFLTTLDKTPGFIKSVFNLAGTSKYPVSDIGVYIQPQHQGVSYHCEFILPYNPHDPNEAARTKEFFDKAGEELFKQGAFFSRPYGHWSDLVYSRDAGSKKMLKNIKHIFDPDNVLNPGKLCFQTEKVPGRSRK